MSNQAKAILTLILSSATSFAAFAAGEGEGATPFAGALYQSIAALICFSLLVVILAKFAWGPIINGLQAREHKIKDDLESAEKARAEADEALATYKAQIAEAQKEAQSVVAEARKSAEQAAAKIKADTEAEIAQMKERAQAEIASAKDAALSEVYAQTAELSTQIAGRILQREINAADQQQLVSDSLAELTQAGV